MRDVLSACHPAVGAAWFALVLAFTVTSFHPVLLGVGLAAGLAWSARLGGRWRPWAVGLLFLSAALFNPLFSHAGATILAYFPTGNPLTLESVLYGLGAGGMLVCAAVWMGCLSRVMTADKWMCLLGRPLPALSLLLSMALRLAPRCRGRLRQISLAQRQLGRRGGTAIERARLGVRQLSVLIQWTLEGGAAAADSMAARGYGLPGRTAYTNYRLDGRDRDILLFLACAGGYLLAMALHGALDWRWYPTLAWAGLDAWSLSAFLAWGALCALPLYLNRREDALWPCAGSKG